MNNWLGKLDKYKYGLFVMVAFYLIFSSIRFQYGFVDRPDLSEILNQKPDDIIELKLEPIEMVEQRMNATGEIQNVARDENSNGSSSSSGNNNNYESSYGSSKSLEDVEQSVYDLEKSFYDETGGAAKRAEIQKGMDAKKKEQDEKNKNKTSSTSSSSQQNSVGNASKGKVLVSYNLKGRNG